MSECSLYRHFAADGALLYVGISLSAAARLSQHAKGPWAKDIARVEVEWFDSRKAAEAAERKAIMTEAPRHNLTHAVVASEIDAEPNTPEWFRAARKRLGLSCGEMAEALGVSTTTISNWSWGHVSIPPFMALAIEALECRAKDSPCVPR